MSSSAYHRQCTALTAALQNKVSYPADTTYQSEEALYWSAQQESQLPACRVAPASSKDVSTALTILKAENCQFAVKSGGHASFAGASNIDSAVAIDLLDLTSFTIASDRKQVSVGTGLRWGQVYLQLDAQKLSVIGGRNSDIGVGGLTLGGGISFFSGIYGWACDNVNNYEVSQTAIRRLGRLSKLDSSRLSSPMDPSIKSAKSPFLTSTAPFEVAETTSASSPDST